MTAEAARPPLVVVMGVSGCGKSTVGALLAAELDVDFVDADSLHPPANVIKMAAGIPLDDGDRWPWLASVSDVIDVSARGGSGLVVACSALTRAYREALTPSGHEVAFVHLTGSPELLQSRLGARTEHFMPATLLASQLRTLEALEPDERGFELDVSDSPEQLAATAAATLSGMSRAAVGGLG